MQAATGSLLSLIEACPGLTRLCLTAHRQVHAVEKFSLCPDSHAILPQECKTVKYHPKCKIPRRVIESWLPLPPCLPWSSSTSWATGNLWSFCSYYCFQTVGCSPVIKRIQVKFNPVFCQECVSDCSTGAGRISAASQTFGLLLLRPTG